VPTMDSILESQPESGRDIEMESDMAFPGPYTPLFQHSITASKKSQMDLITPISGIEVSYNASNNENTWLKWSGPGYSSSGFFCHVSKR
jgi:hypothetical protein